MIYSDNLSIISTARILFAVGAVFMVMTYVVTQMCHMDTHAYHTSVWILVEIFFTPYRRVIKICICTHAYCQIVMYPNSVFSITYEYEI